MPRRKGLPYSQMCAKQANEAAIRRSKPEVEMRYYSDDLIMRARRDWDKEVTAAIAALPDMSKCGPVAPFEALAKAIGNTKCEPNHDRTLPNEIDTDGFLNGIDTTDGVKNYQSPASSYKPVHGGYPGTEVLHDHAKVEAAINTIRAMGSYIGLTRGPNEPDDDTSEGEIIWPAAVTLCGDLPGNHPLPSDYMDGIRLEQKLQALEHRLSNGRMMITNALRDVRQAGSNAQKADALRVLSNLLHAYSDAANALSPVV